MTQDEIKPIKYKPTARLPFAQVVILQDNNVNVIIRMSHKHLTFDGYLQHSQYRINVKGRIYYVNRGLYYDLIPYSSLCMGKKIKSLVIIGLLCHTTVGTEFTSTIFINGYKIATVGPGSNCNDFFKQAAVEWLNNNKYFNGIPTSPSRLSIDLRDLGIPFYCSSVLVKTLKECYSGV